jgi:hypothetical protein
VSIKYKNLQWGKEKVWQKKQGVPQKQRKVKDVRILPAANRKAVQLTRENSTALTFRVTKGACFSRPFYIARRI